MNRNCINEVMTCQVSEKNNIMVGMAATKFVGSDRYAYVVTDVINDKKILVSYMYPEDYDSLNKDERLQYLETSRMGKYITLNEGGHHMEPVGVFNSKIKI